MYIGKFPKNETYTLYKLVQKMDFPNNMCDELKFCE